MTFKKRKLVYITACAKILVATWNPPDPHKEDNIKMYDVNAPMDQYIPPAPEYSELQQYENVVYNRDSYNNHMMPGTSNTEAPMHQYNSFASKHSELQQYENVVYNHDSYNNSMIPGASNSEAPTYQYIHPTPKYLKLQPPHENKIWDYNSYNNNSIVWEFYNPGVPTGSGLDERIGHEKIRNPSIEELIKEFRQAEHNPTLGMQLSTDEHTRRIDELIRESDIAELGTSVEHSVTELRQAEQNLNIGTQQSTDEFDRWLEKVIKEQETVELSTLMNDLGETPILEPIEEYKSYEVSEQSHSSTIPQSSEGSSYDYSNSTFLNMLLHSPVSFITAESIRMRFSGQFLSFLSSDQVIRVLIVLLENKLELLDEDQKEFIKMIFGHVDYSLELVITKNQVVMLVEAMMKSNVPDYFEQVFLTWKMWYSFTVREQEIMLKDVKMKYKREILVMLYLFVMNRDEDNSQQCEIFKDNIKNQYKKPGISKKKSSLANIIIKKGIWLNKALHIIIDTFDTCLLDIPVVFKDLNKYDVGAFWNFFKENLFSRYHISKSDALMYKSHVCYALTKFTREIGQINSLEQSSNVETNSKLYFDPENIKSEFRTWMKTSWCNNKLDDAAFINTYKKEFVNAFAMIRQITQSNNYNCNTFLELFDKVNLVNTSNKSYFTLLFSLTSENILKEWAKTRKWAEYIKKRSTASHSYQYLENLFMNNANNSLILHPAQTISFHVIKIHESFVKSNIKKNATMHREYYFYQRLLFHPRSIMFNDTFMLSYIEGLSKIGRLNSKEQRDQIARDLVFNEYYHEAVMKLKDKTVELEKEPRLVEFKKSIEKEYNLYKNREAIETERLIFKEC
ncbi:hypothetical protein PAEPH01_0918 [Pancytospora epiphaga]|nr:hypothetical protein PAEPH01_0918 [Pancytospora epiphaga]